ncbi:hypothetical protein OGAPHI_000871 [Ogataea philodendri]|uniref:Zn(2)-C6 fungal-type domain-containing protein n=1 Tax=Ogataea philodendri TaxID=1378263 RepID=A0A9P8PGG9_9ASCO|nr:uncharacterized protein OGAPHI_000871 [Ogataea philodendri]KAH3671160.1 hypothetical protein OGAPHI_000871 [Ogataea philodendri]
MLLACNACKRRKKKCDFEFPSCLKCKERGAICEYYDEGVGGTVSRVYLKDLNDRIAVLKDEIKRLKTPPEKIKRNPNDSHDWYQIASNGCFIEYPNGEFHHFGPTSAVSIINLTSRLLHINCNLDTLTFQEHYLPRLKVQFDYNMISNDHSKLLIENYLYKVYPIYPILPRSFFDPDLLIRNYAPEKKLFILLILLVSSAHLQRSHSHFVTIKAMIQPKVVELLKAKVSDIDHSTLVALLYYAVYETLDPECGQSLWKTLSLACEIAEKLQLTNLTNLKQTHTIVGQQISKFNLLRVLMDLDISNSLSLGRPPLINLVVEHPDLFENDPELKPLIDLKNKCDMFRICYSIGSDCPIKRVHSFMTVQNSKSPSLWIICFPLIFHSCSECESINISFNVYSAAKTIISGQSQNFGSQLPLKFAVDITDILYSSLSLITLAELNMSDDAIKEEVVSHIETSKQLLTFFSLWWPSCFPLKQFLWSAADKILI